MLYTPASQFVNEYDDTTAGTATFYTLTNGVAVTGGASNTKGSWVTLVSATDRDWYGFGLAVCGNATTAAGTDSGALLDIGIGGAGSEVVLLPDYLVGGRIGNTSAFLTLPSGYPPIFIPLFIPKGTRIAARCAGVTASIVRGVALSGVSGASVPAAIFSGCDTYGVTAASSKGTNLASNASANTFGTWTSIGSTTTRDYKGMLSSFQCPSNVTVNQRGYVFEAGYASTALLRSAWATLTSEVIYQHVPDRLVVQNIQSGTQLQGRISCITASNADTPSAAIHCFY